jgi:hypothetical protein
MPRKKKKKAAAKPTAPPGDGKRPFAFFLPKEGDDLSSRHHRQAIGYLGLLLSPLLWLISAWRPTPDQPRWTPWDSVSSYYYSGGVAVFAGVLASLAVFMFTYWGYENEHKWWDRTAAWLAGAAALGVAAFPTGPPGTLSAPSWWTIHTRWVHYASAGVLFSSFVFYSIVLFRKHRPGEERSSGKKNRDWFYLACGIVIVASMAWAGLAGQADKPIFWPETLALTSFAFSWLAKGRAEWTLARGLEAAKSVATTGQLPTAAAKP